MDSLKILDLLKDEQVGLLTRAIYHYQLNGTLPANLDHVILLVIQPFINQFERDNVKYNGIVERNTINGKKGGRGEKSTLQVVLPKQPSGLIGNPKKASANFGNPKKPKQADSDSDSVSDSVSVNDNESESELIQALNSQSQILKAKPQLLNAEIQFPCIHLTPDQLKPMERFSDKTKNEILKHFNTFLQKMVDNHKPKDKGQQEALLNEMVTYQASAIIDALKKAYIAGYQVPYFDKSKINDTSQIRMEPMQDPSILKRALETS